MLKYRTFLIVGILFVSLVVLASPSFTYTRAPFIPQVSLGITFVNKVAIYASTDRVRFTVTVTSTADVQSSATATVDFGDFGNPGGVVYEVPVRTQNLSLPGNGAGKDFSFVLITPQENTHTGTVTMQFKLTSATNATAVAPLTREATIVVQSGSQNQ